MIFAHTCLTCGCTSEPRLIEVGAVLIIRCDSCDGFIRYTHINDYPDLWAIKNAIWDICLRSYDNVTALTRNEQHTRRQFWRMYLDISKNLRKKLVPYYKT